MEVSIPYTINGTTSTSSVFRVEKVHEGCVTLLILAPNSDPASVDARPYVSTNQFVTLNLGCVCVLQCLPDAIVDNV